MEDGGHEPGFLPPQRSEALSDGIFAVAMMLVMIELKLPEHGAVPSAGELAGALTRLLASALAVAISAFLSSPALANLVFVLMAVITPLSRRIEKRELRRSRPAGPVAAR